MIELNMFEELSTFTLNTGTFTFTVPGHVIMSKRRYKRMELSEEITQFQLFVLEMEKKMRYSYGKKDTFSFYEAWRCCALVEMKKLCIKYRRMF